VKRSTVAALIVGSALGGAAAMMVAIFGYAFIQSGEDQFSVWIETDATSSLVLKQCDAACTSFHDEARLSPGERVAANTVVDVPNWWRVDDPSGRTLGCLPLLFGRKADNAVVRTSQLQECPQ
jgi:hypothetical protein